MRVGRLLASAMVAFLLLGGAAARAETPMDVLLTLMRQRLAVMPQVAKSKYNTHDSIEDLPRERALVDQIRAAAPVQGIDAAFAARFMQAQIDAAKIVEARLIARWTSEARPPFDDAPDLRADIRPVLDRLTPALLTALAAVRAAASDLPITAADDADPVMREALETAIRPLRGHSP